MKKIFAFGAVAAVILAGSACSRANPDLAPIAPADYTTSTLAVTGYKCLRLSQALIERCAAAKGVLQNNVTMSGFGQTRTLGCYPSGTTTNTDQEMLSRCAV